MQPYHSDAEDHWVSATCGNCLSSGDYYQHDDHVWYVYSTTYYVTFYRYFGLFHFIEASKKVFVLELL
jgi:hypothetical protein